MIPSLGKLLVLGVGLALLTPVAVACLLELRLEDKRARKVRAQAGGDGFTSFESRRRRAGPGARLERPSLFTGR